MASEIRDKILEVLRAKPMQPFTVAELARETNLGSGAIRARLEAIYRGKLPADGIGTGKDEIGRMCAWFIVSKIQLIYHLVGTGVLAEEMCPEPNYWHWHVRDPDGLPTKLEDEYHEHHEIRWYGHD